MSLLFADDDQFIGNVAKAVLKSLSPDITVCTDGKQALEAYKANEDFKVIILDVNMPVMSGLEACREIRKAGFEGTILALSSGILMANLR